MRKGKLSRKNISLAALGIALCAAGVTFATTSSSKQIINHAQYDTVDITLTELPAQDENNDDTATAGEYITIRPVIKNEGAVCFIRMKPTVTIEKTDGKTETITGIKAVDAKTWQEGKDGYFYNVKKLNEEKSSRADVKFQLPTSWDDGYQGQKLKYTIRADAVQYRNFSAEGARVIAHWKGLKIEKTVRSRNYLKGKAATSKAKTDKKDKDTVTAEEAQINKPSDTADQIKSNTADTADQALRKDGAN